MKTPRKTAKTIKPFSTEYRGYIITVPEGSTVTNKTRIDCDDNYRFWVGFEKECERLTGFKDSILQHDLQHYGLNIPKEYCEPYDYSEKKEKTKKQKCLEMWKWLEANPALTKIDYLDYLIKEKRTDEFEQCWACVEAVYKSSFYGFKNESASCGFCPIWIGKRTCLTNGEPYAEWGKSEILEERKLYASQIVEMIEKNWKE